MGAVIDKSKSKIKIERLMNKTGSKCYFLNINNTPCKYKNRIDFDSFELGKKSISNIITAQYLNNEPIYLEDNLGFHITHFKCLIENVKNDPSYDIVILDMKMDYNRIYENRLFLKLDDVIEERDTKVFLEYYYKDRELYKNVRDLSVRFSNCNLKDVDNFLNEYTNFRMIKIEESLLYEYILEDTRLKKIMKLLEDGVYLVVEGER